MSIPFRIDNNTNQSLSSSNNIQNVQYLTLSYTFDNTPDNSVVYPKIVGTNSLPNFKGMLVPYIYFFSLDQNLAGAGSTTILFLDNPNGDTSGNINDIFSGPFGLQYWGFYTFPPFRALGFSTSDLGYEAIDAYNYPYLAIQVTGGSIVSGTVYIKVMLFSI